MERVVNLEYDTCEVYIGRPSIWGNPYSHEENTLAIYKTRSRKESIEKYRDYVLNNPELLSKLPELEGKVLGCWCKPLSCHGDILIELLNRRINLENI